MNGGLNHCTVTILGSSYTVISDESPESVLKAASLVDSMMCEIAQKNPSLSLHVVAMLVALQISHGQQKLQNEYEKDLVLCNALITVADQCLQLCSHHQ